MKLNCPAIAAYRATRFQGIASAESLGLNTLLLLGACCPTAITVSSFPVFSSKEDAKTIAGHCQSTLDAARQP